MEMVQQNFQIFLQQLQQAYACSGQQYLHSALGTGSDILYIFYKKRAFQRADLNDEIQHYLYGFGDKKRYGRTIEDLYAWHRELYGQNILPNEAIIELEVMNLDNVACEI